MCVLKKINKAQWIDENPFEIKKQNKTKHPLPLWNTIQEGHHHWQPALKWMQKKKRKERKKEWIWYNLNVAMVAGALGQRYPNCNWAE